MGSYYRHPIPSAALLFFRGPGVGGFLGSTNYVLDLKRQLTFPSRSSGQI
jgi:hypothetical protein